MNCDATCIVQRIEADFILIKHIVQQRSQFTTVTVCIQAASKLKKSSQSCAKIAFHCKNCMIAGKRPNCTTQDRNFLVVYHVHWWWSWW